MFRNKYDQPWSSNVIRIRFRTLRKRFPELAGIVAYCYRHAFTTDGMVRGIPIATMAELLGHSSTAMIENHYGYLAKEQSYLHQAAFSVTQREPDGCAWDQLPRSVVEIQREWPGENSPGHFR